MKNEEYRFRFWYSPYIFWRFNVTDGTMYMYSPICYYYPIFTKFNRILLYTTSDVKQPSLVFPYLLELPFDFITRKNSPLISTYSKEKLPDKTLIYGIVSFQALFYKTRFLTCPVLSSSLLIASYSIC